MHPDYRPDIDGLRAVAVLAVIAYHAFPDWLGGGFVGVDVFFVISGFLISGIILSALEQGRFSFAGFYARRVRRLFPALAIVLAACYAFGWRELLPQELSALSRQIVAAAAFVSNLVFWHDTSYFNTGTIDTPLIHLWSLGVEEQFYAVWPLCLWLAWRWRRRVLPLIAAIALLSFAWNIVQTDSDRVAAFFSPFTRFWELLSGALLVPLGPKLRIGRPLAELLAWLGVLLIAWASFAFSGYTAFPGWPALLPVSGICLLIVTGSAGAWLNRRLLSDPAMVKIGLMSYPLYLWHWPLLSFAHITGVEVTPIAVRAMLIAASFLLAWATWRLVERPVRSGGPSRVKIAALCSVLIVVGLGAAATIQRDGIAARFPERTRALATYSYDYRTGAQFGRCWLEESAPPEGYAPECLRRAPNPTEEPRRAVLLWGDSHAGRLYPGLHEAAPHDVDILELTRNSCAPIVDSGRPNCAAANIFALAVIKRLRPQAVLLFASWTEYWTVPGTRDLMEAFADTLDRIHHSGAGKIIVLGPAPRWSRPLPRLLVSYLGTHSALAARPQFMSFGLSEETRRSEEQLREVADRHGAIYVSLLDLMCNTLGCLTGVDGGQSNLTTWDNGHFTGAAAAWVAGKLFASAVLP